MGLIELSVFVFCLVGCGLTCHALGKREGIENCITHLVNTGVIELEDE